MNLLQLIQQTTNEIGTFAPNSLIGSTSADAIQLLALATALGGELQRQYIWNALNKEYRFNTAYVSTSAVLVTGSATITIASTTGLDSTYTVTGTGIPTDCLITTVVNSTTLTLNQPVKSTGTFTLAISKTKYAMPSDYDRMNDATLWDKTQRWQMLGPMNAQQWQLLKSGFTSTSPRVTWRILGNLFQIWPPLANTEYLGFEYLSNQWITDASGNYKAAFTADTDNCIFPDRLMVLGIKKKYFEIKNFDTSAIQRDYDAELSIAKANDAGSATLSFSPRASSVLLGYNNIPQTGFGS